MPNQPIDNPLAWLLIGPFIQLGILLANLPLKFGAWLFAKLESFFCVSLGFRMNKVEVGDEVLRNKLQELIQKKKQNLATSTELRTAARQLGNSGMSAGVPVLKAESHYRRAHWLRQSHTKIDELLQKLRNKIKPANVIGWVCLAASYSLYMAGLYFVFLA